MKTNTYNFGFFCLGSFSLPRCWYSCTHSSDGSAFSRKIEEITTGAFHFVKQTGQRSVGIPEENGTTLSD